jgi:hypothetical protein
MIRHGYAMMMGDGILDFGFWILDFGFWIMDYGLWILDYGFWIMDFGFWIMDYGFWMFGGRESRRLGGFDFLLVVVCGGSEGRFF